MVTLLFICLFLLLIANVPISISIGVSSLIYLIVGTDIPLTLIPQRMYNSTEAFTLLAVPLFILSGNLMDKGGLSKKIVDFSSSLVGFIKGGLSMVAIVAAMFFAGISGSSNADTAAIGSILIPAMKEKNYESGHAASIISTAGSIGVIIPPSIPMVVYASVANVSVGAMFLGGIIPGILAGISLMVLSYIIAVKINLPSESSFSLRRIWITFKTALIALLMPLIVLGGLFSGFFTATEAAAVAVAYSFFVGVFIYKKIHISDLVRICLDSAVMTSIPMLVVATVGVFGWILAREQIPALIGSSLLSLTTNKYILLLLFNILFLIVGTFIESLTAIILLAPIILPITNQLGIDPIFIGVMMVFNLAIGMSTPPVGVTLYVSCSIAGIELHNTFKYLFLYIGAMIIILFIITYTPGLIMFFPNMFLK